MVHGRSPRLEEGVSEQDETYCWGADSVSDFGRPDAVERRRAAASVDHEESGEEGELGKRREGRAACGGYKRVL